jgi:hypothetical protein
MPRIGVVDAAMVEAVGGRGPLVAAVVIGMNKRDRWRRSCGDAHPTEITACFDLMSPLPASIFSHDELPRLAMDMKVAMVHVFRTMRAPGSDFREGAGPNRLTVGQSFKKKKEEAPGVRISFPLKMTSLSGNSTLTTIGAMLILHSTYSCLHYRSLAIAADLPDTSSPPLDVVVEVLLGFALCLAGQLMCGPFHRVRVYGGALLGGIERVKNGGGESGGSRSRREIIAPAYKTRDYDLFNTRVRALSMAMRK